MQQLAADAAYAYNCGRVILDHINHGTTTMPGTQQQVTDQFGPHFTGRFQEASTSNWATVHVYTDAVWNSLTGRVTGDIQGPNKHEAIANPTFAHLQAPLLHQQNVISTCLWF